MQLWYTAGNNHDFKDDAQRFMPAYWHRLTSRPHLAVLTFYSFLALLLTWPLVVHITTHVPGIAQWAFDESTFIWNIWYLKHALVDQQISPLHTELIWYPLGIDLVLYTYNFYHAFFAQPLALAINLPFASNVTLLTSTVLSGYGVFLLVRYLLSRDWRLGDWEIGYAHDDQASNHLISNYQLPITTSPLPALIAGLLYAFASNRAIYAALGHYDMVTTQWIPFYALMLLRSLDGALSSRQRRKAAMLAGLFFAFNGLAEMITAVFLAIFTLIVIVVWLINRRRGVNEDKGPGVESKGQAVSFLSAVAALVVIGLVGFLIWSPVLLPILNQFLTNDFSLKGWGEAIPLSTDLLGWFTPTVLHPLFGGDLVTNLRQVQLRALEPDGIGLRDINTVFLGWVSLALALVGALIYRRKVRVWIWTSLIFGLFTLGPFLQINGRYRFDLDGVEATFPLPYALLHYLPIIKANRAPNRNSVLLMLGLAVLAGYAIHWLLQKLNDWTIRRPHITQSPNHPIANLQSLIPLTLALLILFEHLAIPAPLSDARIPAVYAQIAADPRPVSVLQLPLGWRNSFGTFGPEQTQLQYFQTAHGKPILGGNISRAPDFKLEYFARIPLFQALEQVQTGKISTPEIIAAAQAQAADMMLLYNVGYVLLYPPIPQRFPYADHWQATWDFVKATLPLEPTPFWTADGIEAYRVVQPGSDDQFTLDLGTAGTYAYRGEGWDEPEIDQPHGATGVWATAAVSRLFVPLREVDATKLYKIAIQVRPFVYPGSPPQSVSLTVNDTILEAQTLSDDWQAVEWQVSGQALIDGLNRIELGWAHLAVPRQVVGGSRQIGGTGVALPIDAELKGFADGGFMALFDETGRQIDASAGRRGVNVTVLDPASGRVIEKRGFDTAANSFESEALSDFLMQIEPGTPVLVVSYGAASAYLTPAAIEGLRTLGADVTIETLRDQYFALIGVKGAAPGSAALQMDANEAFLRISLERDRRPLAGVVDWVTVGK